MPSQRATVGPASPTPSPCCCFPFLSRRRKKNKIVPVLPADDVVDNVVVSPCPSVELPPIPSGVPARASRKRMNIHADSPLPPLSPTPPPEPRPATGLRARLRRLLHRSEKNNDRAETPPPPRPPRPPRQRDPTQMLRNLHQDQRRPSKELRQAHLAVAGAARRRGSTITWELEDPDRPASSLGLQATPYGPDVRMTQSSPAPNASPSKAKNKSSGRRSRNKTGPPDPPGNVPRPPYPGPFTHPPTTSYYAPPPNQPTPPAGPPPPEGSIPRGRPVRLARLDLDLEREKVKEMKEKQDRKQARREAARRRAIEERVAKAHEETAKGEVARERKMNMDLDTANLSVTEINRQGRGGVSWALEDSRPGTPSLFDPLPRPPSRADDGGRLSRMDNEEDVDRRLHQINMRHARSEASHERELMKKAEPAAKHYERKKNCEMRKSNMEKMRELKAKKQEERFQAAEQRHKEYLEAKQSHERQKVEKAHRLRALKQKDEEHLKRLQENAAAADPVDHESSQQYIAQLMGDKDFWEQSDGGNTDTN